MKKIFVATFLALPFFLSAATYAFVNSKTVIEESKLGKQEQATFENLRKQMESVLEEKEKELNDMATRFSDPDYLDTLSVEAETELKRKFRQMTQEFQEKQNQFYQALQQANLKIMTNIGESIAKASEKLAKDKKYDAIFNFETTFYAVDALDVSKEVVSNMDKQFEEDLKAAKSEPAK
jgi:outer membrane protein